MTKDTGQIRDLLRFGGTPLTDPRSLGSSALFHVAVVLVASLSVLPVAFLKTGRASKALYAEVDPVDNRAEHSPVFPARGVEALARSVERATCPLSRSTMGRHSKRDPRPGGRDLAGRNPAQLSTQAARDAPGALPGPQTAGQGIIPGSGSGGGGGAGGGSGGGVGRGIGPGTQFFGARDHAHSFAYVIDCSGSMTTRNSLDVAKRELLASVSQLPPDAHFAVIFYNSDARMLRDSQGHQGLMAATASNKARMQTQLAAIPP